MRGSLVLATMLLSQHQVYHPGSAIRGMLWSHDVMGILKSHGLRFDLMCQLTD